MAKEQVLVNRVANSGVITIKLEEFFPKEEAVEFDLKDYLFMELILKEKDFRAAMDAHDWAQYTGKNILVFCSADAIIPIWAYMIVSTHATPYVNTIFQGTATEFYKAHFESMIQQLDMTQYENQRVVIKGCSDHPVPAAAYVSLTRRLRPVAKRIFYGEPCSTVPIYKKAR